MKIPIERAYFGIKIWNPNTHKLESTNLFNSQRVRLSVAQYIIYGDKIDSDPILYCFGDTRARIEYEFMVDGAVDWGHERKVDIYTMYVMPNRGALMEIVKKISKRSAKRWLQGYKRA